MYSGTVFRFSLYSSTPEGVIGNCGRFTKCETIKANSTRPLWNIELALLIGLRQNSAPLSPAWFIGSAEKAAEKVQTGWSCSSVCRAH